MTLRQTVRRPTPPAPSQPPRPAAPSRSSRSHQPTRISPPVSLAYASNCRGNPASQRQAAPITAPTPGTLPAAAGLPSAEPFGAAVQIRPLLYPAGPPREAATPAGTRHRRCLSPGVQPAPCTAGSPSSALFPQVARIGPLPVGVLWASCRPLCVVGLPAARDGGTSRDGGPTRSATGNPTQPGDTTRGDRNASGPSLTKSPRPRPRT